ncbi:MAG: SDR family NAD(P)-dependent oxidoreductase, partial [Candidatus Thiodiazotropha sp.]
NTCDGQPADIVLAASAAAAVDSLLLDLVAQGTGFPQTTLTMEMCLLDDLNMDSIKAAELIAQVSARLGVSEEFDPAQFANASLRTIADQLSSLSPSRQEEGFQTAEATAVAGNPRIVKRAAWVRDFAFEPIAVELSSAVAREDHPEAIGETLILCDENEHDLAGALCERLRRIGGEARQSSFASEVAKEGRFKTIVAVLPRVPESPRPLCERLPILVERLQAPLRYMVGAGRGATPATVVFVQFGGGFFGKGAVPGDPEQCCATALAASLHLERPELKVRILDFAVTIAAASLSERVWLEVETPEPYAAVGYDDELTRRVPRPRVLEPASYASRPGTWSCDDVVLVTGGAKGITAECVYALARETGVRLALVGSSPADGREASGNGAMSEVGKNLQRFREAGLTVQYYRCDVSDGEAVELLVAKVRQELGEITGVIHGAGLNKPALLGRVASRDAISEVSPKVLGATNLCQALEKVGAPLKMFLGLSSIIGLTGMQRNGWYAFSNEALSLVLAAFRERHPACAVLSLAFSVWDEVGMGVRMGSTAHLAKLGIDAIPVSEGVTRFLRLFMFDPGVHEVVTAARLGGLDTWAPTERSTDSRYGRFLEQIFAHVPGVETIVRARLSLERDPYLRDHVWRGSHLFPTVFGLEAMAQAVAHVTGETDFGTLSIEDVDLERPIVVDDQNGTTIEIRAEVLERDDEHPGKRVKAEIAVEQTGFARAHFSGVFVLGSEPQAPVVEMDLPAEPLDIEPQRDLYGWLLFQGDAFQRMRKVYALDAGMCLIASGLDVQANGKGDQAQWLLGDAYFRDSMLQSVQLPLTQTLCLPVALDRIERYGVTQGLSASAYILAKIEEKRDSEVLATIVAMCDDGRVLERIRGRMRILEHRSEHPTPEALAMHGKSAQYAGGQEPARRNAGEPRQEKLESMVSDLSHSHSAAIERAADGRTVLVVRFPVTFREAAYSSRTLYFSHYFSWIGKLRETIVEPVSKEMVELLSTGEWGMVTNSAEIVVDGDAKSGDIIEARAWIESLSGRADSTVEMRFQWYKQSPSGVNKLLATGRMSSTWVAIRGQGK